MSGTFPTTAISDRIARIEHELNSSKLEDIEKTITNPSNQYVRPDHVVFEEAESLTQLQRYLVRIANEAWDSMATSIDASGVLHIQDEELYYDFMGELVAHYASFYTEVNGINVKKHEGLTRLTKMRYEDISHFTEMFKLTVSL